MRILLKIKKAPRSAHFPHSATIPGNPPPNQCDQKARPSIDLKGDTTHVLLGEAARELLASVAGTASGEWVFPGSSGDEPLDKHDLYKFWLKARDAAGIVADARLHDLRHTHASHAVMNGESLHVTGRLLGHRQASTTNRYVHLDDATLSQAAERIAKRINGKLNARLCVTRTACRLHC